MSLNDDLLEPDDAITMEVDMFADNTEEESQALSIPATTVASESSVDIGQTDEDEVAQEIEETHDTDKDDYRPPSMPPPNTPIRRSYVYVSPKPTSPGPYAVGVDEAGRGPALGPLVYAMAFCPVDFVDSHLNQMGFDDSKALNHETRVELLKTLSSDPINLGWAVSVISPQDISSGMLSRPPTNLNTQSQNATISLLNTLLAPPYSLPISHVYVDALGPAEKYQAYLQSKFRTLDITVRNKADSLFKIVGAASVAAKVTRDYLVENWIWEESIGKNGETKFDGNGKWGKGKDLGSGYPSDPNTKEWISSHLDATFGFPSIARFSWAPIKQASETKGHQVQWVDEGQKTLMKAFEAVNQRDKDRPFITKELGISSLSSL
ncbi:ribonuclease H-like protein [Serendipita vermifera]|nr:ribonuclease H-like protein [Serendipita vermifera]